MQPTRDQLRTILRDQDKTIWSNDELDDMLDHGLTWWNLISPETNLELVQLRAGALPNAKVQQSAVLWASVVLSLVLLLHPHGLKGNVTLTSTERAKYEGLLANAEGLFEESKMAKAQIVRDEATTWH